MAKYMMNMYENDNEYGDDSWETKSFDFGSDDEYDEKLDSVIDVESVRTYVREEKAYQVPIVIKHVVLTIAEPTKTEKELEQEVEEKKKEIAEIEAVQAKLAASSWCKKVEVVVIDSDSDSDSDDEDKVVTKNVEIEFDFDFPTLSQGIAMKVAKNTDATDGWKTVGDRQKAKNILSDKVEISKALTKTKLCDSIRKNVECRHGANCRFAHSVEELVLSPCLFGKKCRFVAYTDSVYANCSEKKCMHQHPEEELENYYIRTGLKQRASATEEEMDDAYAAFCSSPVPQTEKQVSPKKFEPKKFEFKKFENVQNKPKKAILALKARKLVAEDLETQKIKAKNEISNKLRDFGVELKRKSETLDRFKNMNNISEFYKKQIKKLESEIANINSEVARLETELKNVASMKKVEIAQPVIVELKPEIVIAVKKVVAKPEIVIASKKVDAKPALVIMVAPKPKIVTVEVEQAITPKSVDDGFIEVKSQRNNGFNFLQDKTKIDEVLTRTKMCTFGKDCTRGDKCRFAHNKEELQISNCAFGAGCKFTCRNARGYENVSKTKICLHRHTDEHINNFYFRVGIDKVSTKTQHVVKPILIPVSKSGLNISAASWTCIAK